MYATFRNKLATLFFSKIFYYIFGYFKTFIGWETRHFNLNVLYKESDIILFSMWYLYTSIFLKVFLNYSPWWWSWFRLKRVLRSDDWPQTFKLHMVISVLFCCSTKICSHNPEPHSLTVPLDITGCALCCCSGWSTRYKRPSTAVFQYQHHYPKLQQSSWHHTNE